MEASAVFHWGGRGALAHQMSFDEAPWYVTRTRAMLSSKSTDIFFAGGHQNDEEDL
jgi:hypothetical protein